MDKKLFDGGLWEIVFLTAFFLGLFALLCLVISIAIMMVIHTLEAVDDYKNRRKW